MAALSLRDHPTVSTALQFARLWCSDHQIDDAPAIAHALAVAATLTRHGPEAGPDLIAAVLLHDAPEYAPETGIADLDALLTSGLSAEVTRIVQALEAEHQALSRRERLTAPVHDEPVLYASVTDKIVSLTSALNRGETAHDPGDYWSARQPFLANVGYFRAVHGQAASHLPTSMAQEFGYLVTRAELIRQEHAH